MNLCTQTEQNRQTRTKANMRDFIKLKSPDEYTVHV